MSRNLVVCCDGTNNQFGPENTNVLRLVEVLVQDPQRQLVYYDPGVGTMPEPHLLTRIGRTISKWMGLAVGAGLMRNVEEAYTFLMQNRETASISSVSVGALTRFACWLPCCTRWACCPEIVRTCFRMP